METQITPLYLALTSKITDSRDNRGKRHDLAFMIILLLLAVLSGKTSMSSIWRFMRDKYSILSLALEGGLSKIWKKMIPKSRLKLGIFHKLSKSSLHLMEKNTHDIKSPLLVQGDV